MELVNKKYTITGENCAVTKEGKKIDVWGEQCSDGYHTFDELYDHRIALFIALCKTIFEWQKAIGVKIVPVWRSKLHSDGSSFEGWFILGIWRENGKQITYHLPNSKWEATNFAETLDKAPEFDGHTSEDVLERIKRL